MKRIGLWYLAVACTVVVVVILAGCGGGQPETPSSVADRAVAETEAPGAQPTPQETATDEEASSEPPGASAPESVASPPPGPAEAETLLLSWERQGGPESRCDHMTIYPDHRVVAVQCTGGAEREAVEAVLSDEQAALLETWVERFESFSRRESDVTSVAMRTVLEGRGDVAPSADEKTVVTRFAKELFLSVTSADSP